jgi:hypothetical protein
MAVALFLVLFVGGLLVFLAVVRVAAERFELLQRRRGRWDEHGPRVPTRGPPRAGGGMSERLEVTGQWVPRPDDWGLAVEPECQAGDPSDN